MEKVKINVCVKPYYHDIVDTIVRKPTFNKRSGKHYVTYNKEKYEIRRNSGSSDYIIWVDDK